MDVREKLVELLDEVQETGVNEIPAGFGCTSQYITNEIVVAHLISHGVTVQEWISVKDRLPEEGDYALCVLKGFNYGGKIQVCKFVPADKFKDKPYFEHFRNGFPSVTHWMPLPQPPKGE